MTLPVLIVRYALFAAIATVANLGVQRLVMRLGDQTVVSQWRWQPWCQARPSGAVACMVHSGQPMRRHRLQLHRPAVMKLTGPGTSEGSRITSRCDPGCAA